MIIGSTGLIPKKSVREGLLRRFNDLHPGSLDVLLVLCSYSKDGKTSTVSIKTIREKTGFESAKITICLDKLEERKFIERLNRNVRCKTRVYGLMNI